MSRLKTPIVLFTLLITGCASTSTERQYRYGFDNPASNQNHADSAAYGADNFTVDRLMPVHKRTAEPDDFYSKHCSRDTGRSYYSKTDYECSEGGP